MATQGPIILPPTEEQRRRGGFSHQGPGPGMPVTGARNEPEGSRDRANPKYTPIGRGSPAAEAAAAERDFVRHRPDVVARRAREGK